MTKEKELKNKLEEEKNSIEEALGLERTLTCFLDGKPRKLQPVTLKDYPVFMEAVSTISLNDIFSTFLSNKGEGLKTVILLCFGAENVDDILENVDATNYKEFILQLFEANGIKLLDDVDKEASKDKKK